MSISVDTYEVMGWFPKLTPQIFKVTSPKDKVYNCMAWAAMRDKNWWWEPAPNEPGSCWPKSAPYDPHYSSYVKVFELLGYQSCNDDSLEPGFEKVAVFKNVFNTFTHVTHQRENGEWTSKIGPEQDINHNDNASLETVDYGIVAALLKRPRQIFGDNPPPLPAGLVLEFF